MWMKGKMWMFERVDGVGDVVGGVSRRVIGG